jgi:hypothetical protein
MPKLVAIGDSLTQGFQSGCISRTEVSYPALIASAMEAAETGGPIKVPQHFRYPRFRREDSDPNNQDGLPLNLEVVARRLGSGKAIGLGENLVEGVMKILAGLLRVLSCFLKCAWNIIVGTWCMVVGLLKIVYLWGFLENLLEDIMGFFKVTGRTKNGFFILKVWNWFVNIWSIGLIGVGTYMNEIEMYWERGDGIQPSETGPLHHNLAVWGFSVVDADSLSWGACHREILKHEIKNDLFAGPDYPMYRTARRTLNPSYAIEYGNLTQIDLAKKLGEEEPIEHLIFWLGSNNALGTILRLGEEEPVVWATEGDLHQLAHARKDTLWPPELFEKAYRRVTAKLTQTNAEHVYIGNVPHLNVPPTTRGVSLQDPKHPDKPQQDTEGYFEYYTNCWVDDNRFRLAPSNYASFTRETMKMLNGIIDQYNQIIDTVIAEQNQQAGRRKWKLVNICSVLDRLAYRRNQGQPAYPIPQGLKDALKRNPNTQHRFYKNGDPILDTRYFCVRPGQQDSDKRFEGGIVSLDGVHPTTIGYGIVANEFMQAMGISHLATDSWWDHVVANDSLINDPPKALEDLLGFLQIISKKGLLQDIGKALS